MWMRLPVLLAGVGSLLVLPLMLRGWVGRGASTSLAWLLAISPLHVFLSRFARPYAISLLLVMVGAVAFGRWWEDGRARWPALIVGGFVLGPYFHLSVLPVVLATLGLGLAGAGWGGGGGRRPREVVLLGGAVAVGLAVLVGLPLAVDHAALAYKAGRARLGAPMAAGALELMAGTAWTPALAALAALVLGGGLVLARERPRLLALLGAMALAGPAAILATRPVSVDASIVAARYCLVVLPVALLLAAVALARGERGGCAPGSGLSAGTLTAASPSASSSPPARASCAPQQLDDTDGSNTRTTARLTGAAAGAASTAGWRRSRPGPRILEAPWWHAWENVYFPATAGARQYGDRLRLAGRGVPSGLPRGLAAKRAAARRPSGSATSCTSPTRPVSPARDPARGLPPFARGGDGRRLLPTTGSTSRPGSPTIARVTPPVYEDGTLVASTWAAARRRGRPMSARGCRRRDRPP
jgi:hypothetical protein